MEIRPHLSTIPWIDRSRKLTPWANSATFAYDAAGRETSTTDRDGRVIAFSYDNANRKTGETWYAAGGVTVVNLQTFTYDAVGDQLTAADFNGAYTMGYDALN